MTLNPWYSALVLKLCACLRRCKTALQVSKKVDLLFVPVGSKGLETASVKK